MNNPPHIKIAVVYIFISFLKSFSGHHHGGRILGGDVLIFSYLILIHQLDDLGSLCDNFGSDFIGYRFA